MIGIGGISMSALADILLYFGFNVSGSDVNNSPLIEKLKSKGIDISLCQSGENIKNPDLVCYTAAISKDNPELLRAKELNIPTLERAELLGLIMKKYKYPLAIAGTHGKTTTTSMLSLILLQANLDPTILVGGELKQIDGNIKIGKEDYLVFEACEYVESFLNFHPFLSIITNIEEDHLDYFVDLSHIITSFKKFSSLNSPDGLIIVCSDDKNVNSLVQNIDRNFKKYAIFDKCANFLAKNIENLPNGGCKYDILYDNEYFTTITLTVSGTHNVYNSLGAAAAAASLGISASDIQKGLESFEGTKRRYERIGEKNGFFVVDDYAHHPTEIKSTLETAKNLTKGTVWCIFQPHTYTRTKAFLNDFATSLSLSDRVILTDIYAARELDDGTIHSKDLAKLIPDSIYIKSFEEIAGYINENAKKGDTVITMGAGDVYKIGKLILS